MKLFLLLLFCCVHALVNAQIKINTALLQKQWTAAWISAPDIQQKAYGVYHFRKTIQLAEKPAKFIVHITADNRYRLFVNGKAIVSGPARGDLYNWYFETLDIGPYLTNGNNTIAALVWNMAEHAPVAQVSNQTGFVLQGDSPLEQIINTNNTWKVFVDSAFTPCSLDNQRKLRTYMVIGPGDDIDGARFPWGWETSSYDDTGWKTAIAITKPEPVGYGTDNFWTLAPRTIPLMEESLQRVKAIRRTKGIDTIPNFLTGNDKATIPANTEVSLLLDQSFNTVAYPELLVSGGKGTQITLTYAEALFDEKMRKGNRNEIDGRFIRGNYDIFRPDGGAKRLFRPLWFRTFRYVQLDIKTGNEPLILEDFYGIYTGYPFEEKASFSSNDASLQQIWDVGWRTARLCAGETYFDCPYYEQLQYEGDTRIQALISLYVSGDDRLMRKAITDFYHSRVPEGLTQGRYPSNRLQVIPPFSLYWVSMLYDYRMHRADNEFLRQFLHAATGVLGWYEKNMDTTRNMLGPMKWWNFVDWDRRFANGVPDGATDGNSSVISLQFAYTLQQAAELFASYGRNSEALHYRNLAKKITTATYKLCFDSKRGVMANTPEKKSFSQHASIMGILTGSVPAGSQTAVMNNILKDTGLSQATFYYRFYLTQAMKKAGMADLYYSSLTPWHDMLKTGLTTFAENPEPTRSDCHAWSSSPNYDFLATICGILPAEPGFASVLIRPALGELTNASGTLPHPLGTIAVSFERTSANGLNANIELPKNVTGTFVWKNRRLPLKAGKQQFRL